MDTAASPSLADLAKPVERVFELAAGKIRLLDRLWDKSQGTPIFTVAGQYTTRGWTEWTQGFQYGCALLTFDVTDDDELLELGRQNTLQFMAPHVTHTGVHDHGFNNISTYGNLRRLMKEGRIYNDPWELNFYQMALKASGAVQASRWTQVRDGGFIYSFNGPHSLFIDTMRTIRILEVSHQLGHVLMGENDRRINLLERAVTHALTTARYIIYKGDSGQPYDVRGRTALEGIFNINDGNFRCRSTQQGYSPFSTWTRGLAWAMLGFVEQLEFFQSIGAKGLGETKPVILQSTISECETAARNTCDHYLDQCSTTDGIVYWDDGAPGLSNMPHWRECPADPFNNHEPVDSSAAVIAAQGLLRLGRYLGDAGARYTAAALSIAKTLFAEPYLSIHSQHQGLLLHSIYHRPNGWDHVPPGRRIPCGESSMWGDYHVLELALLIRRLGQGQPHYYYTFFDA